MLGGKGASLRSMLLAGHHVPEFFVVTNNAYDIWLSQAGAKERVLKTLRQFSQDEPQQLSDTANALSDYLSTLQLPDNVRDVILDALSMAFAPNEPVAIRSSANLEDSHFLTFAGMFRTFLNVRNEEEVIRRVRDCFVSVFSQ